MFLVTNCAAIDLTSRGHVAEKNSVWRSRGMDATMRWIWGSKPMSSMRSASSNTRYDTWWSLTCWLSRKSFRRPGVAMMRCTPYWMSRSWGPLGAPPYVHLRHAIEYYFQQKEDTANIVFLSNLNAPPALSTIQQDG